MTLVGSSNERKKELHNRVERSKIAPLNDDCRLSHPEQADILASNRSAENATRQSPPCLASFSQPLLMTAVKAAA